MGVAILDKIIAHFEGKPFGDASKTEPGLITKENVDDPNLWGNAAEKALSRSFAKNAAEIV
jgi:hypothetical protein